VGGVDLRAHGAHLRERLAVAAVDHRDPVPHLLAVCDHEVDDAHGLQRLAMLEALGRAGRGDDRDLVDVL
jgi:hypothetical protein